ncbi:MAG: hypothetical protein JXO44_06340 [Clostridia bacterium]|nr:hypothetical protein [Clostridia bacterium]
MSFTVEYLKDHSNLPSKRGNLELLYEFAHQSTMAEVMACLESITDDLENSPEEFVAMCGILGFCVQKKSDVVEALLRVEAYSEHSSWRIREAVAMGIQELMGGNFKSVLEVMEVWSGGSALKQRAIVAGLCEPCVLNEEVIVQATFKHLKTFTLSFKGWENRIDDDQKILRQALGYAWSVAVVASPAFGKAEFENLIREPNKHVQWIVKNNLKKKRLEKMDLEWTQKMQKIGALNVT